MRSLKNIVSRMFGNKALPKAPDPTGITLPVSDFREITYPIWGFKTSEPTHADIAAALHEIADWVQKGFAHEKSEFTDPQKILEHALTDIATALENAPEGSSEVTFKKDLMANLHHNIQQLKSAAFTLKHMHLGSSGVYVRHELNYLTGEADLMQYTAPVAGKSFQTGSMLLTSVHILYGRHLMPKISFLPDPRDRETERLGDRSSYFSYDNSDHFTL